MLTIKTLTMMMNADDEIYIVITMLEVARFGFQVNVGVSQPPCVPS